MTWLRRMIMDRAAWAMLACVWVSQGCATTDLPPQPAGLVSQRDSEDKAQAERVDRLYTNFITYLDTKPDPKTIDLLVISGGGDWGAFGAGVLKGWGRVDGDLKRPQFDIVTGVSTGALIAPFAFLGDDESIEQVVQLYRHPQADWAKPRGALYFMPGNQSMYEIPGLERDLKKIVDRPMLQRIVDAGSSGRALVVNTTNVDHGNGHAWNLVDEARQSLSEGNESHVQTILLASSAIPGIFPARRIGSYLYVDGAITGNILYGGRVEETDNLWSRWERAHPDKPLPKVRFWVIFNNQIRFPPQMTGERWIDIIGRASIMSTQSATVNAMRHLYSLAEIQRVRRKAEVEVRVMSVPDEWIPPKSGTFNSEVMNALADLGEKMGADSSSWGTESP